MLTRGLFAVTNLLARRVSRRMAHGTHGAILFYQFLSVCLCVRHSVVLSRNECTYLPTFWTIR